MREILLTSSLLILVLIALRYLLRGRIRPRVQYALWLLAAVRLLEGDQAYDYAAIVFACLAGAQGHQYWKTRRMLALVCAAVCTLVCAANLLLLFLG